MSGPASAGWPSGSPCGGTASRRGLRAAPELTKLDAVVGVGGNATRLLRRSGLLEELEAVTTVPTELVYRRWLTGEPIAAHPGRDGDTYLARVGASWLGIHRAQYQRIPGTGFGGAGLHLGHRLVDIAPERTGSR